MLTIEKIKTVINDSRKIIIEKEVERTSYENWLVKSTKNKLIKAISGFRRSGKTFLLKQLSRYLEEKQRVPFWNIGFFNFEHDLLSEIKTVEDLRNIFNLYIKNIAQPQGELFLIFDEIQNIKNWERLVRTLYEEGRYNIFISGSNSQLLSGELTSKLGGRFLELTVYPFNFKEYLLFQDVRIAKDSDYYQHKTLIDRLYQNYLLWGGLPEQFTLNIEFKKNYAEALIQKIILDDIIKRHRLTKAVLLKDLFQFIVGNVTSYLSLRKMSNMLRLQGMTISVPTLAKYIDYFQSAYVFLKLPRFSYKLYRLFEKTNKYYAIDNLLLHFEFISREKRLENLVAIFLVQKHGQENVFFGKEDKGYEVDFIIKKPKNKFLLIQVCLYLTDENKKREIGNLLVTNKYLKGRTLVVVEEDMRKEKGEEIEVKNIREFLLGI